jgi:hypothetical protein
MGKVRFRGLTSPKLDFLVYVLLARYFLSSYSTRRECFSGGQPRPPSGEHALEGNYTLLLNPSTPGLCLLSTLAAQLS